MRENATCVFFISSPFQPPSARAQSTRIRRLRQHLRGAGCFWLRPTPRRASCRRSRPQRRLRSKPPLRGRLPGRRGHHRRPHPAAGRRRSYHHADAERQSADPAGRAGSFIHPGRGLASFPGLPAGFRREGDRADVHRPRRRKPQVDNALASSGSAPAAPGHPFAGCPETGTGEFQFDAFAAGDAAAAGADKVAPTPFPSPSGCRSTPFQMQMRWPR